MAAMPRPVADASPARVREVSRSWWVGLVVAAAAGAWMAWSTWARWPDVTIDFGRELYVPWRLAEGQELYRDLAHLNGPLSPTVNALWMRLLGASLRSLFIGNLVVVGATTLVLWALLCRLGSRLSATCALVVFMTCFAFAHLLATGNYAWMAPYAHEVTHGMLLAFASLWLLSPGARARPAWRTALAGLALGLSFLTKPETFLAALLGVVALLLAERATWRTHLALAGGAALGPLLAWALLSVAMPTGTALRGTLGAWPVVLSKDLAGAAFYRKGMGLDDVGSSVASLIAWSLAAAFVLGGVSLLACKLRGAGGPWPRLVAAPVACLALLVASPSLDWSNAGRPLPLAMLGLAALSWWQARSDRADRAAQVRFALAVLGGAALLKLGLFARLHHYGFALAVPATLLCVHAAVDVLPDLVERRRGDGRLVRAAVVGLVAAFVVAHVQVTRANAGRKTVQVGAGADAFWADDRGRIVNEALAALAERAPPDRTLLALPEGAMLNFLSRRVNPTSHVTFMPVELEVFGEASMLASLEASPPDVVALVDKDAREYGLRAFGRDHGLEIAGWLLPRYDRLAVVGQPPLQGRGFGIELLERRGEATP